MYKISKNIKILKLKFYSIKNNDCFINPYKTIISFVYPYIYPRLPSPKGTLRDTHVAVIWKKDSLDKKYLCCRTSHSI